MANFTLSLFINGAQDQQMHPKVPRPRDRPPPAEPQTAPHRSPLERSRRILWKCLQRIQNVKAALTYAASLDRSPNSRIFCKSRFFFGFHCAESRKFHDRWLQSSRPQCYLPLHSNLIFCSRQMGLSNQAWSVGEKSKPAQIRKLNVCRPRFHEMLRSCFQIEPHCGRHLVCSERRWLLPRCMYSGFPEVAASQLVIPVR